MRTASWVVRELATGRVIFETFNSDLRDSLNTEKYEMVPVAEYLASLNSMRPITTAKKDGTAILAKIKDRLDREDLERWQGLYVVIRHPGLDDDGFDIGWNMAAPVGCGGFPDEWFDGWAPLPSANGE